MKGRSNLQALVVKDSEGNTCEINVDETFDEMGLKINVEFMKNLVKINQKGEIKVNDL